MKICGYCGYRNWNLLFVKVSKTNRKVVLCDSCGKRIDNQAAQCNPMIGGGVTDCDNDVTLTIGILSTGGGEED